MIGSMGDAIVVEVGVGRFSTCKPLKQRDVFMESSSANRQVAMPIRP